MTDECRIILDEALTASDNGVAMSEKVTAHLATCSECRRSLEATKALSASVESVLPTEDSSALKLKISKKLEASMQARKAAALKSASTVAPASLAMLGLGIAATVAIGAYCLGSSNSNQASVKNNQTVPVSTTAPVSSEADKNNTSVSINQSNEVYQEIFSDGYNGDLRNFEKVNQPSESVPSATKD